MSKSLVGKQYDDFIWELKYRPTDLDKIVLPEGLRNQFNSIKESGNLPNMLFSGPPGCGKTTVAFVLADVMDLSAMYINMSLENSIDIIRNKLLDFATSVSMTGQKKVIIGDEFDRLSPAAMDSLKGIIEQMSKNCKFIFTSNHKGKIIDPIISRLQEVDFIFSKQIAGDMKKQMWKAACGICTKEDVTFEKQAVAAIVKQIFPDMRKVVNHLQMMSLRGDITMASVEEAIATDSESYFKMLQSGDWTGIRQYIADLPISHNDFYSILYANVERYVVAEHVPAAIVMIAKYQYEAAFAVDKQIPLAAFSIEMMETNFRKDF